MHPTNDKIVSTCPNVQACQNCFNTEAEKSQIRYDCVVCMYKGSQHKQLSIYLPQDFDIFIHVKGTETLNELNMK